MLRDHSFLAVVRERVKPEYFEDETLRRIVRLILQFYDAEKSAPETLIFEELDRLRDQGRLGESPHQNCNTYCDELFRIELQNRGYLESVFDDFCWQKRIETALLPLAECVEKRDREGAEQLLKSLVLTDRRLLSGGIDYTADPARRIARRMEEDQQRLWLGIPPIDAWVPGLKGGEVGLLLSRLSSDGKTTFLCHVARAATFQNKNVLICTGEESAESYEDRLDQCFAALRRDQLTDAGKIHRQVGRYLRRGSVHIYEFAPGSTRVSDLRQYAETCYATRNWRPDVVLVDYLDKCAPETPSLRTSISDSENEIFLTFEAWMKDWKIPGWTVAQAQRAAAQEQHAEQHRVGGAVKKIHICHVALSISRDDASDAQGVTNVKIIKNRDGIRGAVLQVHSDWEKLCFSVLGYD